MSAINKGSGMAHYRQFERKIGIWLNRHPVLKRLKTGYQWANYQIFHSRMPPQWLHPSVQILTPADWAETNPDLGTTFFGYYDKSPWSSDMRYLLSHHQSHNGQIHVVLYDSTSHTVRVLGVSPTWTYQQGAMVQWVPMSPHHVAFNTLHDRQFVTRIVNTDGNHISTLPLPIQVFHPDGRTALSINYRRLAGLNIEYGYTISGANLAPDLPLEQDGIWHIDLTTGREQLLVCLADLVEAVQGDDHYGHHVNHLMYAPDGSGFVFLHRWKDAQGRVSRLYYVQSDGSDQRLFLDTRTISHYNWRDPQTLLVWAQNHDGIKTYLLIEIATGTITALNQDVLTAMGDGHPSYSPDQQWIVTDTYPDRKRQQHLLLYHPGSRNCVTVGHFLSPWSFQGDQRCDLHPRWSPDGKMLAIDTTFTGQRQLYLLDVHTLLEQEKEKGKT